MNLEGKGYNFDSNLAFLEANAYGLSAIKETKIPGLQQHLFDNSTDSILENSPQNTSEARKGFSSRFSSYDSSTGVSNPDRITGLGPNSVGTAQADDFAASTATTGSITVGGTRTGVVNANADRDWFSIALTAGQTYRFNLNGNTLSDPTLTLRSATGTQLAFNDDFDGRNSQITYTATSTGTFYLDAGAYSSGTGSYTLLAANTTPAVVTTDDFAATTSTTGTIAVGGTRTGVVNVNADRDWFRIALTAGQTYRFNLNGNTLSDPTLTLRNATGTQLAFNDDFDGRNSQITYTATSTGTFYLDAGAYSSGTGSYTLLAASTATIADDFTADTNTNGSVAIGRETSGSINFAEDRDWFRTTLTAGRSYRLNLNGTTLTDPTLSLRDSSGRNILASNNDFASGLNSQITFTATATGTYYLDAGANGSLTGTYAISVTDLSNNVDRITGLVDTSIRRLINTALEDNLLSHQELSSLLRTTGAGGVTSQELSDLRTISNQFAPYLSATSRAYHQYIYNAIVNDNAANQWWTGGTTGRRSLGSLAAGSTQTHMNQLADKWFGGLDLPTNFVGGDSAAGANSLTFNYQQMTGNLFVNDVNFSDINQGQAGTCYFLAACSTLANNQRQLIHNMFRDNGDGTYGVRFYGSTGNELWVTVNRAVPVLPGGSLALAGNASRSLSGEMWVALAEKAYAQANEIGAFGRPTQANSFSWIEGGLEESLRHISNANTTTYSAYYSDSGWTTASNSIATWNNYRDTAIAAINSGRSLWLGSFGNTQDSSGKQNLVSGHAFAIIGYSSTTGRFTISNPWGAGNSTFAGVFEASWQDIFNVRGIVSWV